MCGLKLVENESYGIHSLLVCSCNIL